jgi:hypothetical protein
MSSMFVGSRPVSTARRTFTAPLASSARRIPALTPSRPSSVCRRMIAHPFVASGKPGSHDGEKVSGRGKWQR